MSRSRSIAAGLCCLWALVATADNARETAGRQAKAAGHRFEAKVAALLSEQSGLDFAATGGSKKADVVCEARGWRISLKNPSKHHTQVALLGQESLARLLGLDEAGRSFVRLFFGLADGDRLDAAEVAGYGVDFAVLSEKEEIGRNRLLYGSIPETMRESFMKALNGERKALFVEALIGGDANLFGWAYVKDDPKSVRYFRTRDLVQRLRGAKWVVSSRQSTLHLVDGDKKYMHVQMKGSSKRYSAGYHSVMIHVYDALLEGLETVDPAKSGDDARLKP